MVVGPLSGSVLVTFLCFLHHVFALRIFIDFGMEFGRIVDVVLMNFPFAHPPCKTFKFDDPYNEFAWFYTSEDHDFL